MIIPHSSPILECDVYSCQISGVNVQTTLTRIKAENMDTGEEVIWNGRISGQPMYVYKVVPIITSKPVSQSLQDGWVTLNAIGISNSFGEGYIEWKEITYSFEKSPEVEISSTCLSDLLDNNSGCMGGYLIETLNIIDGSVGSTSGFISFMMINMEPAHSDMPLVLQAKLAGVVPGSYISTWVDRPSVYAAPDSYPNLVENSPNMSFAWSDRSAEPHRLFSKDWNSDGSVQGLPTAKQTVTTR
ncbi:MAG: hypothetical protein Q7R92_03015 [bacterium]|nr:hypothetical protein [bacterium]